MTRLLPGPPAAVTADEIAEIYTPPAAAWVRANLAVTLDAAVEIDGRSGGIGGPADRALFLHLRAMADVVLVGAGTARSERYGAVVVDAADQARRAARGQSAEVPVAVVTAAARLDPSARLFQSGTRPLVLTCAAAPPQARSALAEVADVEICGQDRVDPGAAIAALARRGLRHVHCEGGPALLADLLAAGVLDELELTTAPLLAGGGRRSLTGGDRLSRPVAAHLASLLTDPRGTLFARYLLERP